MNDKTSPISWYRLSIEEIQEQLHTDLERGLDDEQIEYKRNAFGKNVFERGKKISLWTRLYNQIKSPLVIILVIAGITTFLLGEYLDSFVIVVALLINLVVGYFQENRAESAFEKLVESQEKFATVIRSGGKTLIPAEDLVPGDIVFLESGMYVPADLRLYHSKSLMVNESTLTGEWVDVPKDPVLIGDNVPITEQQNMGWMGTFVTSGAGSGIVIGTGINTEIGHIAEELGRSQDEVIPLQKNILRLAKALSYLIIVAIVVLLIAGIAQGYELFEMLLIAVAIAVAVAPSGLPAAVTVVLAIGMEAILKKGGLVRNLLAAETLGNTTVILTDKTGTLTRAEMRIADIITPRSLSDHDLTSKKLLKNAYVKNNKDDVLRMATMVADAYVEDGGHEDGAVIVRGRPVERAVIGAAVEQGISQQELFTSQQRLDYLAFESKRRFAASLHRMGGTRSKKRRVYFTGAPELMLEHAQAVYKDGKKVKMSKAARTSLADIQMGESALGMRLVAVAYRDVIWSSFAESGISESQQSKLLDDLVFCGFLVLHDPMRSDVPDAIETAHQAGTRVIMVTGDNPVTAGKIAFEAGITKDQTDVIVGPQLEEMEDIHLSRALKKTKVFARVLPQQKLRIARLLKSEGEVVAMTGDGINDGPALRSADIGISLGSGTEVAKEASDLILLNDSFSIIVDAIREGRRIRDNLKKIVTYLVSTSFSGLLVVFSSILTASPLPILPAQILWINIIEEGFMNFAFAFEPAEKGIMRRDPKSAEMKQILTSNLKKMIVIIASVTGTFLVSIYLILHFVIGMDIEQIRTIIFIGLAVDSIFFTFSIKDLHRPIWKINLFSNRYLLLAFFASVGGLVAALELPVLRELLQLEPIRFGAYALLFGIGFVNLMTIELAKYFVFRRQH